MADEQEVQRLLRGYQDQLAAFQAALKNPQAVLQHLGVIPAQQSAAPEAAIAPQGLLLKMFEEFAGECPEEAGKLASSMVKFGRFLQSKASRA